MKKHCATFRWYKKGSLTWTCIYTTHLHSYKKKEDLTLFHERKVVSLIVLEDIFIFMCYLCAGRFINNVSVKVPGGLCFALDRTKCTDRSHALILKRRKAGSYLFKMFFQDRRTSFLNLNCYQMYLRDRSFRNVSFAFLRLTMSVNVYWFHLLTFWICEISLGQKL